MVKISIANRSYPLTCEAYSNLYVIATCSICLIIISQESPRSPECGTFEYTRQRRRSLVGQQTLASFSSHCFTEYHHAVADGSYCFVTGLDSGGHIVCEQRMHASGVYDLSYGLLMTTWKEEQIVRG